MSETLMRQWQMLSLVPRYPSKVSTSDMVNALAAEGYTTTQRTVQRDLVSLSAIYPLESDERNKPYGWSWMANGAVMDIPGMDSHTALAFWMASKHLEPLLPKPTAVRLQPYFKSAAHILDSIPTKKGAPAWRNKVRMLQRGPALEHPTIAEKIQRQVYDALLLNHRLEIVYAPRNSEEPGNKEYEINPLGLVFKDGVTYLVCSMWDYEDLRYLPLHRIKSATMMDKPASVPDGFDLDGYIATGVFGYMQGDKIKLQAIFSEEAAFHLGERPLSDDQRLEAQDDEGILVTATVRDNAELRWWLMGFGAEVEVLTPSSIRNEMKETARALHEIYGG